MYVIQFRRDSKVRYATETQGNPEYNAIDSANLAGAKKWKTKKGADNYLKRKVLLGRIGQRIQARWPVIEIVEIEIQQPPGVINEFGDMDADRTEHTKNILLLEIEELQQSLENISTRLKNGNKLGAYIVDASKVNNLIGRFQLLTEISSETNQTNQTNQNE